MAKTRLNEDSRMALRQLMNEIVVCPKEQAAVDKAYAAAEPLVRRLVEKKYPPKDMEVLKRHDVGGIDDCIKLKLSTDYNIEQFLFAKGTGPYVAKATYYGQIYDGTSCAKQVGAWVRATEKRDEALETKRLDYKALIANSRYFEDVAEVWPEAEQLRDKICTKNKALTTLSDDVIKRIKKDVKSRQAA